MDKVLAAKSMKRRLQNKAWSNGIEFNLKLKDIIIPEFCPVLGIPLIFKFHEHSPTFYRIDKSKGYVRGNFVIISRRASVIMNNILTDDAMTCALYKHALSL